MATTDDDMPRALNPRETLALLVRIDEMLRTLGERIARVVLAGELNDEQQHHVRMSLAINDGLRRVFTNEIARLGGEPPQMRES